MTRYLQNEDFISAWNNNNLIDDQIEQRISRNKNKLLNRKESSKIKNLPIRKIIKTRPQHILSKKVMRVCAGSIPPNPVKYLVRWKNEDDLPQEIKGSRWLGLVHLKHYLDLVERYEIANYDGPLKNSIEFNKKPVDEKILASQITANKADIKIILDSKQKKREKILHDEIVIDHQSEASDFNSTIQTRQRNRHEGESRVNVLSNFQTDRIIRRYFQSEIVQGSFLEKDRAETLLNSLYKTTSKKYSFLVTWATREDGIQPSPSWVDQDELRDNQLEFLRKIIKDKNLNIYI